MCVRARVAVVSEDYNIMTIWLVSEVLINTLLLLILESVLCSPLSVRYSAIEMTAFIMVLLLRKKERKEEREREETKKQRKERKHQQQKRQDPTKAKEQHQAHRLQREVRNGANDG